MRVRDPLLARKGEALAGEFGSLGVTGSNQSVKNLTRLVKGTMAHWDLHALFRDRPRPRPPLTPVVGERDRAVRPPARAALIIELSAKSAPMLAAG